MSPRRKTVARGTWRTSADMLWLRDLLRNIGLRPWVETCHRQGARFTCRSTSLVKHLDKSPAQYTLQLGLELSERGTSVPPVEKQ